MVVRFHPPFQNSNKSMKITTSFDFGNKDIVAPSDVTITVEVETRLGDIYQLPNVRDMIADSIVPLLKHLRMDGESIKNEQEIIRTSGYLFENVNYPYIYDVDRHKIVDQRDRAKKYPISDWLEGRLPD